MSTRIITTIIIIVAIVLVIVTTYTSKRTPNKLINSINYQCNEGKTIKADYFEGGTKKILSPDMPPIPTGSVTFTLSDGRTMTLMQTISASGVRYVNDDESFIFWSKGNGVLILENNKESGYTGCVAIAN